MSMLEQLGAQLRATADELPLDAVAVAVQRLRLATDLLMWVRQSSANPIGIPGLASATEHLEQASYALRVGQDSIGEYLVAVGLAYQSSPPPDTSWRDALGDPGPAPERPPAEGEVSPLGRWWEGRVNYLAEHNPPERPPPAEGGARTDREAARDSAELLRQTAKQVREDNRDRLRAELARVEAPVGLGLAALTPPVLRHLATELLGHEPGPDDLPRLEAETRQHVRRLMPRMPEEVVTIQLARVCRVKPPKRPDKPDESAEKPNQDPDKRGQGPEEPPHPTDTAVAGALLTGILLRRLDRDPETLRPPDEQEGKDGKDDREGRYGQDGGRGGSGAQAGSRSGGHG